MGVKVITEGGESAGTTLHLSAVWGAAKPPTGPGEGWGGKADGG